MDSVTILASVSRQRYWINLVVVGSLIFSAGISLATQNDFNGFYAKDATIASATTQALESMSLSEILIMAQASPNKIDLKTKWPEFVDGARAAGMSNEEIWFVLENSLSHPKIGSVSGIEYSR